MQLPRSRLLRRRWGPRPRLPPVMAAHSSASLRCCPLPHSSTTAAIALLLCSCFSLTAATTIKGCSKPDNPTATCGCRWTKDETDKTTFTGLLSPASPAGEIILTTAEVTATGLDRKIIKAASQSVEGCELFCCQAKQITNTFSGGTKTGPCGVWQYLKGDGCWVGLDLAVDPLKSRATPDQSWVGASGNLGPPPNWGWPLIITLICVTTVYIAAGLGYSVKVKQLPLNIEALPQIEHWRNLSGLFLDGCAFTFHHTKQLIGKAAGADTSSEVGAATTAEPLLSSAGNDNTPPIIAAKGVNVARVSEPTPFVIGSPPAAAPEVTLLLPLLAGVLVLSIVVAPRLTIVAQPERSAPRKYYCFLYWNYICVAARMYTMVLKALFSFCRCLQPQQQRRRGPALARAAAAAAVMMTTWWSRWPRLQQFCSWLRTSRKLNTHERCATRERERQKGWEEVPSSRCECCAYRGKEPEWQVYI
eukprot:COSAG05_NODE_1721_length_4213_cov_2.835197_2_plen_475_part_00